MRVKFLVDKVIDGKNYHWGMQYEYGMFDEKVLVEFEKANEIKIIGRQEPQIEDIKVEIKEEVPEVKKKRKTKKG